MIYKDIYIMRHQSDRFFQKERLYLDNFRLNEIFGDKRADEIVKEACEILKLDFEESLNISCVTIDMENQDKELQELAEELIEQSLTVSGDDDFYDYFPDQVYAFQQICEALDRIELYKEVTKTIRRGRYSDDTDIAFAFE